MAYRDTTKRLAEYRRQIAAIRTRMRSLQSAIEPEEVADYHFSEVGGEVSLGAVFGEREELIAIHSMGISCPYCTLWADGYNGVYEHLASRAAFVLTGPDTPAEQQAFKRERGWRFRIVSHRGTTFAEDMGYRSERGALLPGLSVFKREGSRILRVADAAAKPGDDFNPLHHILELFPSGVGDWTPKLHYP